MDPAKAESTLSIDKSAQPGRADVFFMMFLHVSLWNG
jgi:hypothetical protein